MSSNLIVFLIVLMLNLLFTFVVYRRNKREGYVNISSATVVGYFISCAVICGLGVFGVIPLIIYPIFAAVAGALHFYVCERYVDWSAKKVYTFK